MAGERVLPCFQILGPVRARRGDEDLDLGPGKQRAVLAVLLLNANKPVATAQIVDAVWRDEPPENGANVVQKYVAGLRRVLEPHRSPRSPGQVLTLTEAGYLLSVDPGRLDAEVFAQRVRDAHGARDDGDLTGASAHLREALDMWQGEALAGLSGPLFDSARERLTDSRAGALEAWADLELRLGRHAEVVPRMVALVAEFPLREELRYLLILALYRAGRQAESLAAFREARRFLADEFGVEPGERLQELHRQILRSDPALAPLTAPAPVAPARPPRPRPAPGPPPPVLWAPPPPPQIRRQRSRRVAVSLAIAIPIVSCGLASWAVIAYYAVRRRSLLTGLSAVGYFGLDVLAFAMLNHSQPDSSDGWAGAGVLVMLTSMLGAAVQGAVLAGGPSGQDDAGLDPVLIGALEQRVRRDQARQLVYQYPAIARELAIGRPDLPRRYDDGGLVDVNSAPAEVLAALPGVDGEHARRIVAHRTDFGPLSSLDDLVAFNLLPYQVLLGLYERLVVLP